MPELREAYFVSWLLSVRTTEQNTWPHRLAAGGDPAPFVPTPSQGVEPGKDWLVPAPLCRSDGCSSLGSSWAVLNCTVHQNCPRMRNSKKGLNNFSCYLLLFAEAQLDQLRSYVPQLTHPFQRPRALSKWWKWGGESISFVVFSALPALPQPYGLCCHALRGSTTSSSDFWPIASWRGPSHTERLAQGALPAALNVGCLATVRAPSLSPQCAVEQMY